jgi:hypothetical protein
VIDSIELTTPMVDKAWEFIRALAFLAMAAGIFLGASLPIAVWFSMPRENITLVSGDEPYASGNCGSLSDGEGGSVPVCGPDTWTWRLGPRQRIQVTTRTGSPGSARGFESKLHRDDDCPDASVDWQIAADGKVFGAGTLSGAHAERELTERIAGPVHELTLTATRTDSATCDAMFVLDRAAAAYKTWWYW